MYTITVDKARRLVTVTIEGFWSADTFAAYARDYQKTVASLPPSAAGHVTLADVTGSAIQPQVLIEAFQAFIARNERPSRKIALVVQSTLPRMQCRRISASNPSVQVFATRAEAEPWLLAPEAAAA